MTHSDRKITGKIFSVMKDDGQMFGGIVLSL